MSEKKTNKKQLKKHRWILAAVIVCLALICGAVYWMLTALQPKLDHGTQPSLSGSETDKDTVPAENHETLPVRIEDVVEAGIDLGRGLWITDVGKYTGVYMEDGSDEIVSGVMMIAVTNAGENDVQYAEITMPVGDGTAQFSLTTLPVGKTVILLEQNRMEYIPGEYTTAAASNVALFTQPLSLREDLLEIQLLDGAINVANISGSDIQDDIVIYYKNSAADVYYGGITYRVRLEGGMKAGELKQIMASHFSDSGSTIMFVTCGES